MNRQSNTNKIVGELHKLGFSITQKIYSTEDEVICFLYNQKINLFLTMEKESIRYISPYLPTVDDKKIYTISIENFENLKEVVNNLSTQEKEVLTEITIDDLPLLSNAEEKTEEEILYNQIQEGLQEERNTTPIEEYFTYITNLTMYQEQASNIKKKRFDNLPNIMKKIVTPTKQYKR